MFKVSDSKVPSRAKLTLPKILQLQILANGSYSVIATAGLHAGTQFGPVEAEKLSTLEPSITFPLKLFSNHEDYYLNTSDENTCNWLMFVSQAEYQEEQNLICYQVLNLKSNESHGTYFEY